MELLLQSIINGLSTQSEKLDRVIENMASKEDVRLLDNRLRLLEANKLPKWFWPAAACMGTLIGVILPHLPLARF